jgi:hypothetical protein
MSATPYDQSGTHGTVKPRTEFDYFAAAAVRSIVLFDVQEVVELRESFGLKTRELGRAQELAEARRQLIVDKWNEHLD